MLVAGVSGVIVSFPGQYLEVRFDGERYTSRCHPTWEVERLTLTSTTSSAILEEREERTLKYTRAVANTLKSTGPSTINTISKSSSMPEEVVEESLNWMLSKGWVVFQSPLEGDLEGTVWQLTERGKRELLNQGEPT